MGFPRMRGDVPKTPPPRPALFGFSPHARGCSGFLGDDNYSDGVFPACAGMFLMSSADLGAGVGFPRMRGDVPGLQSKTCSRKQFSPHARGCSDAGQDVGVSEEVFPACAGMFPLGGIPVFTDSSFPRMRGDVPSGSQVRSIWPSFSPHARGCSHERHDEVVTMAVFPACAGMFRNPLRQPRRVQSFPRMRGDVPIFQRFSALTPKFSPHARGCSGKRIRPCALGHVFPACAGMFLGA